MPFRIRSNAVALLALLAAGAAGGHAAQPDSATITIIGAERMVPLSKRLAAAYRERRPEIRIEVSGGGSEAGFRQLAEGSATIATASRPPSKEEVQFCRRKRNQEFVGTPIAMDAVAFYVAANRPLTALTIEQIRKIVGPVSGTWEELGLPGKAIQLHVPRKTSGSLAAVQTRVLGKTVFTRKKSEHETVAALLEAVADDPKAMGLAGLFKADGVRIVPIQRNADTAPVLPTAEAVQNGTYPLAHYLYWYTAGLPEPAVRDFLKFALSPEGQEIIRRADVGPVPLPLRPE